MSKKIIFDDNVIDVYDNVALNYRIDCVAKRLNIQVNKELRSIIINRIRKYFSV